MKRSISPTVLLFVMFSMNYIINGQNSRIPSAVDTTVYPYKRLTLNDVYNITTVNASAQTILPELSPQLNPQAKPPVIDLVRTLSQPFFIEIRDTQGPSDYILKNDEQIITDSVIMSYLPTNPNFYKVPATSHKDLNINLTNNTPPTGSDLDLDFRVINNNPPWEAAQFELISADHLHIPPTISKAVWIRFYPTKCGPQYGSLEVRHNATNISSPLSISLTGYGATPGTASISGPGYVIAGQEVTFYASAEGAETFYWEAPSWHPSTHIGFSFTATPGNSGNVKATPRNICGIGLTVAIYVPVLPSYAYIYNWEEPHMWPDSTVPVPGDNVVFKNNDASNKAYAVINVPTISLNRFSVERAPGAGWLDLTLVGKYDGNVITLSNPENYVNDLFLDTDCKLRCNTSQHVRFTLEPGTKFFFSNGGYFDYARSLADAVCDEVNNPGLLLKANATQQAEFIQQADTTQNIKGCVEYFLNDNAYHFITPPITSGPLTGELLNLPCRKANCLCVFDGDYIRKYINDSAMWDNWFGNVNCFNPILNIEKGRGYEYYGNPNNPINLYTFYGTFNSGTINLPVTAAGWNFIGNPFPSAITFSEPSSVPTPGPGWVWNKTFTDPVVYWWDNELYNGLGGYRFYNWFTGLGNGTNVSERRTVPRSQGFFVNVYSYQPGSPSAPSGSDIAVGNEARIFRGDQQIGKSVIANKMEINLKEESSTLIDNVIIHFREDAIGSDFDRLRDAYKFHNDMAKVSQLYFKTTDNVDVALKTLQLVNGQVMYPLYLKVANTGPYSLDVKDIHTFSPNTRILLKDNKTNTTVDLKVNPVYTFSANAGEDDARFSLYFTDILGIHTINHNNFKVYSYNNSIFIQNNDPEGATGIILVYDMIGRQMMQQELYNEAITRINSNLNKGIYIVSIKTDKGVYNQKVYIN
jgi:hypothetical protein